MQISSDRCEHLLREIERAREERAPPPVASSRGGRVLEPEVQIVKQSLAEVLARFDVQLVAAVQAARMPRASGSNFCAFLRCACCGMLPGGCKLRLTRRISLHGRPPEGARSEVSPSLVPSDRSQTSLREIVIADKSCRPRNGRSFIRDETLGRPVRKPRQGGARRSREECASARRGHRVHRAEGRRSASSPPELVAGSEDRQSPLRGDVCGIARSTCRPSS